MKLIHYFWGFLVLVGLLAVSAVVVVFLALEDRPLVAAQAEFQADHIFRAKKLLEANDPRTLKSGEVHTMEVSQPDLNLALGYLASRVPGAGISVGLGAGPASVRLTLRLPPNPVGRYLNLQATVVQTGGFPRFGSLQAGRVPLPGFLGDWLLAEGLKRAQGGQPGPAYADLVKEVRWTASSLRLTYQWDDALARQVKAAVVSPEDQARWKAYQTKLAEVADTIGKGRRASLVSLINPLVRFAGERGGDPAAENRALCVVLASYLVEKGLDLLVSDAASWPRPVRVTVTLAGRDDFPKHFAISAAMAAAADTSFADAVGIYKEVKDSRGGSGFSFNDMAADRAGTRFGETAIDRRGAVKLQERAAQGLKESDLFPDVSDLPEFLQEADFLARYGGVGKPEYNAMMDRINARVEALPLLK